MAKLASFIFHDDLNDFLPRSGKQGEFRYSFEGKPSVKDAIEAIGVPHTEVGKIVVNGNPEEFGYSLGNGDRVVVYPAMKAQEPGSENSAGKEMSFILDVHLGKLAKYLRMLGFDTVYQKDFDDPEIVKRGVEEGRMVLTRDIGILKHRDLDRGYWIRSQEPADQVREVITKFGLEGQIQSFRRCTVCNGMISKVNKEEINVHLKPKTKRYYNEFFRCRQCGKIYWQGSHYERMTQFIEEIRNNRQPPF